MAYCTNCGKTLLNNKVKFCSYCGAPVPDTTPVEPVAEPEPIKLPPEPGATAGPSSHASAPFTAAETPLTQQQQLGITILCWLTIAGSVYNMFYDLVLSIYYYGGAFFYEFMIGFKWLSLSAVIFSCAGTLAGALLMLKHKRVGYQLYLIFQLLYIVIGLISALFYYSYSDRLLEDCLIPAAFLILYSKLVKPYLTK